MKRINRHDLIQLHEDVPADHYDRGIKNNYFQKFWHLRRFVEVSKVVKPVKGPVLDVGCHSGLFTEVIMKYIGSKKIYGLDISPAAIAHIKKRIPYGYFLVKDAQKLPFKNSFFDAVFCLEMLEHVDSPISVLREIKRVLKKNGYGVILVPSDNKLFKMVWLIWTSYYPVWRHAHVNSFNGENLEKILKQLNLMVLEVKKFNLGMLKIVVFKK